MGRSKTSKKLSYNDLSKIFGIDRNTIGWRVRNGMTLSDALNTPVNSYMNDLTGKRFSRLFAEYRINGNRKTQCKYHCVCDCGNECDVSYSNLVSGRQKSCGCLNMENRHNRHKDRTGQIINGVKIKSRTEDEIDSKGHHFMRYLCECPHCGSDFISRLANILSDNTNGCGCTRHQYTHHIDLVGKDFEFCHVNKRLPNQIQPSGGSKVIYECTCCCGKKYTDWAYTILHGRSNCGCQKIISKGEYETKKWLDDNNVNYITQYWFDDLRGDKNMPYFFDFAIIDDNENILCLIEYQGEQHYHETHRGISNFGKVQREISDPVKREYCQKNNIKLFEIAYYEDTSVRCKEIFDLLYHDNTVPSSQETA